MRALVLGGRGFIGTHLVQRLRANANEVDVADLNDWDLTRVIPWLWRGWSVVYLLAARLGVDNVEADAAGILRDNVRIVQNVLDWLPNQGETLVFASTSEVYAGSVAAGLAPVPTPEDVALLADPVSARGAYALSKITGESLVRHGHSRWVILRYHNVYGPGQARGFVIPELIHGAPVHNPSTTRAFCYIDDAIEATILASQHPGNVFNVGTEDEVSILDVALTIGARHPFRVVGEPRAGDPLRRCPDTTRLRRLTGFKPRVALDEGLRRTKASYEQSDPSHRLDRPRDPVRDSQGGLSDGA